ncbi:GNAT family N-acetyltransferase [Virgibacillus sp. NKC19-3]|uniref:GNAT family N-acetyltransferase n=1 Tax=Virgibacillus saliphilus TaxID=2831674 RepID=UPI001C9AC80F|nr:GNAT family N-acetyltransferase [Virgibacillus sp. NKC19-3]MBY7142530.1 GNAT family N-acetyltransferase [Virgibacillus sp. NKC19-3]
MEEQIPDKNLFMMCRKLDNDATRELPNSFHVRYCRKNELDLWKAMHFDTPELATKYYDFMTAYFNDVYLPKGDLFFQRCMVVCDQADKPIGTCFLWKSYNSIWTLHWFKVLKDCEGEGIGRALLSIVMKSLPEDEYPVFLHTQPESYRAIKLYSDFGFCLLSDPLIGNRQNDLDECLPVLQRYMPRSDFEKLKISRAPQFFLDAVCSSNMNEF